MRGTGTVLKLFSIRELAEGCGGECVNSGAEQVTTVSIDSRQIKPGALFIPLKGEKADGHDYIGMAVEKGAKAVIIAEREWQKRGKVLAPLLKQGEVTCVVVTDTLKALQDLARFHMQRLTNVFRIGITGSSGKTTTKEILGSLLTRKARTIINTGNLNSETGVPLTAFEVEASHEYAVFEMGINHPGEMDVLADIVRPDMAVITNIGSAHIGPLGSRQGIAAEKKKITSHFTGRQKLFLYEDEEYFDFLARDLKGKVIAYGPRSFKGLLGSEDLGLDGTIIDWEELQIRFPLFGKHNYINALAAIAVAGELAMDRQEIKRGLENVKPLFGRSEIVRGGVTVIKDCYNANPHSMARALEFLNELSWAGRKMAILGSMLELGRESERAHRELGLLVAGLNLDFVFFLGKEAEAAFAACRAKAGKAFCAWYESPDELLPLLEQRKKQGDIILVKGSRALELEKIVQAID